MDLTLFPLRIIHDGGPRISPAVIEGNYMQVQSFPSNGTRPFILNVPSAMRATLSRPSVQPPNFGLTRGAPPMRRLSRRGGAPSLHGHFSGTSKALAAVPFESLLERDFLTLLEADASIRSYAVQAHRLIYPAVDKHGRVRDHVYTPDFVAEDREGRVIVMEVKARGISRMERWRRMEPFIRLAYEELGVIYRVFTEETVRIQPRLSNCEIMLAHGRVKLDHGAEILVRRAISELPKVFRLEDLYERTSASTSLDQDQIFNTAMHLALRGVIKLDLSKPLSKMTASISVH